jgi:hypothetical protein
MAACRLADTMILSSWPPCCVWNFLRGMNTPVPRPAAMAKTESAMPSHCEFPTARCLLNSSTSMTSKLNRQIGVSRRSYTLRSRY